MVPEHLLDHGDQLTFLTCRSTMHGSRYPSSQLGARFRPADRSRSRQRQNLAVKYIRDQPAVLQSPRTVKGMVLRRLN